MQVVLGLACVFLSFIFKMSNNFNAADDEQLVELVAGHRILWDYSENDFKNTLKKELIWKEIAKLLNKTGKCFE